MFYVLMVWGCERPELIGPFDTTEERNKKANDIVETEYSEFRDILLVANLSDGTLTVEPYIKEKNA